MTSFAAVSSRMGTTVRAAMMFPCANAQAERQITKLRLAKRQMYGRRKIDLPQPPLI